MVKIIMHGCNGKMGQVITGIVAGDPDAEIVAGIDVVDNRDNGYPVFTDIDACDVEADVIIDFAAAVAVDKLLDYGVRTQTPIVLCTTGLSDDSHTVLNCTTSNRSCGISITSAVFPFVRHLLHPHASACLIINPAPLLYCIQFNLR